MIVTPYGVSDMFWSFCPDVCISFYFWSHTSKGGTFLMVNDSKTFPNTTSIKQFLMASLH